MSKTWFITGASRGLGTATARAALDAGDNVIATGRHLEVLKQVFGADGERVLLLALDVAQEPQPAAAVEAAVARFGGIDVLVNNAGYGQLGPFEDNTTEDVDRQFATNVFGVFNLCRAVLPVMRKQRSGHVFNISSMGGLIGMGGAALYSASKFAVEGFSESLAQEVAPFGIHVTLVEPGVLRTDFLDGSSARFGDKGIIDYRAFSAKIQSAVAAGNHQQTGSPAKLGAALVLLANTAKPPLRFLAGSDAYHQVSSKLGNMRVDIEQWRDLSASIDGA